MFVPHYWTVYNMGINNKYYNQYSYRIPSPACLKYDGEVGVGRQINTLSWGELLGEN